MGSLFDILQDQAESNLLAVGHGRTFLILSGPSAGDPAPSFQGSLAKKMLVTPPSELRPDPREAWVLDIPLYDPMALVPDRGDQLKELPEGIIWEVIAFDLGDKTTRSLIVKKMEAIDS